ncbi:hypothetical protein Sjap_014846 [Stephania japonica]|uniref:Uncharacterized protein n=1 Tax=Stephania japonica TaxID=461633 RepID=A0AAP0NRW3_9MAGN
MPKKKKGVALNTKKKKRTIPLHILSSAIPSSTLEAGAPLLNSKIKRRRDSDFEPNTSRTRKATLVQEHNYIPPSSPEYHQFLESFSNSATPTTIEDVLGPLSEQFYLPDFNNIATLQLPTVTSTPPTTMNYHLQEGQRRLAEIAYTSMMRLEKQRQDLMDKKWSPGYAEAQYYNSFNGETSNYEFMLNEEFDESHLIFRSYEPYVDDENGLFTRSWIDDMKPFLRDTDWPYLRKQWREWFWKIPKVT